MATFSLVLHLFLLLASSATCIKPSAPKPLGFSVSLIHRDSPLSPLYDPLSTPTQRDEQAILRSRRRSQYLASAFANSKASSSVAPASREYLMQLSIGTPSRHYWLTMDTGSDITWVTCKPCESCFVNKDLLFEPRQSTSYGSQSCTSRNCALVRGRCDANQLCVFQYGYTDQSSIWGNLGSETVTFNDGAGREISFPEIVFGCIRGQSAPHPSLLEQPGLVGLGQGANSLVNQIGAAVNKKFAYCLPPPMAGENIGWLKFGNDADEYSGEHEIQVVSMGQYGRRGTFYTVLLEDISVGKDRVFIQWSSPRLSDQDARLLIVDSGSPLTYLAPYIYDQVKEAVEDAAESDSFLFNDRLCFYVDDDDPYDGLPELTLHFNNADWTLPPPHVFQFVQGSGLACLAIEAEPNGEVGVLGSLAQQNMYIKFDLGNGLLSFAPMDCHEL